MFGKAAAFRDSGLVVGLETVGAECVHVKSAVVKECAAGDILRVGNADGKDFADKIIGLLVEDVIGFLHGDAPFCGRWLR